MTPAEKLDPAAQLAGLKRAYDYVVVGAGSAGCVMAHRLSQDGRASVLVIEGGGTDLGQTKIADPRLWATNIGTGTDWGTQSTPQRELNGRVIVAPVGRIAGGGSSINATVWLKGDKADYDAWEEAAGPAWGFEHIVRGFKRAERYAGGEGAIRGGAGMIGTRKTALTQAVTRAFIESAVAVGKAEHADINDIPSVAGATGQNDVNTDADVRRISTADAYLFPALARENLSLVTQAVVTRLAIEGGRCRGVEFRVQGRAHSVTAAREVVLCAGALMSPKLLMLSGVGPAAHLRAHGVPVVVDAPQVGENLHDHLLVRLVFAAKSPLPAMEGTGHAGIAWHKSNASLPGPDIQVFGRMNAPDVPGLDPNAGYAVFCGLMKRSSRGTLRLASADPLANPIVDSNYFADPAELDAHVAAVELGLAIGNGPGFDRLRKAQHSIPRATRADIVAFIRANAATYFHYVGTCAMGTDPRAPVDPALRVRGVVGLRVVDASVIPEVPSCNTNAPVIALAERAAELMLQG